jgi:hypothetical protein
MCFIHSRNVIQYNYKKSTLLDLITVYLFQKSISVKRFWMLPLGVPNNNPKYYGLKIDFWLYKMYRLTTHLKHTPKICPKLVFDLFSFFFLKLLHFKVSHIPIDKPWKVKHFYQKTTPKSQKSILHTFLGACLRSVASQLISIDHK